MPPQKTPLSPTRVHVSDVRGVFVEDQRPQLEGRVEVLLAHAMLEVDVELDHRVEVRVEIGLAEALVAIPGIDGLKRLLVVEEAGVEVEVLAVGVVRAVHEEDLIGHALHLAGNLRIAVALCLECRGAVPARDVENLVDLAAVDHGLRLRGQRRAQEERAAQDE